MKGKYKYIVIAVVLLLPFIYSFFYLKAYWDPYGKGNIDNIPVAIVNEDSGDKGKKMIESVKNSKKLKLEETSEEKAIEGLNSGKYYAMISIPKSFTDDMESAGKEKKKHATITYSPNQKANFLASQIINSVVNAVEKSLDNEVNSSIVENLSGSIEEVPDKLNKISDGFSKLKEGTSKLNDGSKKLSEGTSLLHNNYQTFNGGLSNLNSGAYKLKEGSDKLSIGLKQAKDGSNQIKTVLDSKISELQNDNSPAISEEELNYIGTSARQKISQNETQIKMLALQKLSQNAQYQQLTSAINSIETNYINNGITSSETCAVLQDTAQIVTCQNYLTMYPTLINEKNIIDEVAQTSAYEASLVTSESVAKTVATEVATSAKEKAKNTSIESLSTLSFNIGNLNNGLSELYNGSLELSSGVHTLYSGTNTLYNGSVQIQSGIKTLSEGSHTLTGGIDTLDSSVLSAKTELDSNIKSTKDNIKKVEKLSDYSKEPVKVKTKEINKVNSYGTAFSPLFMSIGLWIGCLMMFIVFYYDKDERFGLLGINSKEKVKQVLVYHGLITISSLILGLLLQSLLDLNITNSLLYYLSLIIIGNTFMGIIELLIIKFNDIGKFIALILLVLQLAAAGGTFPIETVTKGFRWMNQFLPMTYSINLLKESLIKVQNDLLIKNIIILIIIGIAFFTINILTAKLREENID